MIRWMLLCLALMTGFPVGAAEPVATPAPLPEATWQKLPRWRGFNLLHRFSKDWSNRPFAEEDFRLIQESGFDFVRLPLDYRTYVKDGDWEKFDEEVLKNLDQAVEWGRKYGIHVNLNLHRAPGFCVNPPKEARDLWTDPEAQRVCARHWAMLAKRYRGRPNREVSFNLFNEPFGIDNATYAKVAGIMCRAIRKQDPDRLILCDGNEYGRLPVPELIPLKVAQCTRGYQPFGLTHYQAPWVSGQTWAKPLWPSPKLPQYLYGSDKPDLQGPLVLEGSFARAMKLRLRVGTVSRLAKLSVKADGKEVLRHSFEPGKGEGEWKQSVWKEEWKIYQNVYDRDYHASVPAGTKRLELSIGEGDWLTFSELELQEKGGTPVTLIPTTLDWGVKPVTLFLAKGLQLDPERNLDAVDRAWHWKECVEPWLALQEKGVGVMVGEWGVYHKTPHDVTLRFMADVLANYAKAGWGWALWNFTGDFGPLDSRREDVVYETWEGHQLDRKMLEVLQRH